MLSHESLLKVIRLFKRGVICPSEMWIPLFENLHADDVHGFFERLDPELRALILEEYNGFAHNRFSQSRYERYSPAVQDTVVAIREWCESQSQS